MDNVNAVINKRDKNGVGRMMRKEKVIDANHSMVVHCVNILPDYVGYRRFIYSDINYSC
jgi:hypothetical protein